MKHGTNDVPDPLNKVATAFDALKQDLPETLEYVFAQYKLLGDNKFEKFSENVHGIKLDANAAGWFKGAWYILLPNILFSMNPTIEYQKRFASIKLFLTLAFELRNNCINNQTLERIAQSIDRVEQSFNLPMNEQIKIMNNMKELANTYVMCKIIREKIDQGELKGLNEDINTIVDVIQNQIQCIMQKAVLETYWQCIKSRKFDVCFYTPDIFIQYCELIKKVLPLNSLDILTEFLKRNKIEDTYLGTKLKTLIQAAFNGNPLLFERTLALTKAQKGYITECHEKLEGQQNIQQNHPMRSTKPRKL